MQNDLSDFISHIVNKYENNTFNASNEDHIISQAENLLVQFGYPPNNNSEKKKPKKTKIEKPSPSTNIHKKKLKYPQNQISTLVIAPYQSKPNPDDFLKQNEGLISESSSNINISDDNLEFLDQLKSDDLLLENKKEKTKEDSKKKPMQNRKKLKEIDINTLNNLLDEIEAEFSNPSKSKQENKVEIKRINQIHKKRTQPNETKKDQIKDETYISEDIPHKRKIKDIKEPSKTKLNTEEEENNDFHTNINLFNNFIQKKFFFIWKNKYTVRNCNFEFMKFKKELLFKIFFHRWVQAKNDQQNLPRFKDFNRLKRLEELNEIYQKQIFLRKYLLIWARQCQLKIDRRIQREQELQNPIIQLKVKLKKPKMIKRPPPVPPIEVDPKMDEMIKQNKEMKDQKVSNVKLQIKKDKIKQKQIQQEMIEAEKRKRMSHLKKLQKQKIERQNKMKNEEEKVKNQRIFSLLCQKAEDHYLNKLKSRVLKSWKFSVVQKKLFQDEAKYQYNFLIKKIYFYKIRRKFSCIENDKLATAIRFNNKLLMKRSLIAIQKVKKERKMKFPIVQKNTELHLLRNCFNDWKCNKIASRRKKKLKAIEFYEANLVKRVFNAYLAATKKIKEDEKRKDIKDKLLQKAHQYLDENQQSDDQLPLRLTLSNKNDEISNAIKNMQITDENDNDDENNYEPIQPLKDSLQIPLNLLDLNNEFKFDNDSDDFF